MLLFLHKKLAQVVFAVLEVIVAIVVVVVVVVVVVGGGVAYTSIYIYIYIYILQRTTVRLLYSALYYICHQLRGVCPISARGFQHLTHYNPCN